MNKVPSDEQNPKKGGLVVGWGCERLVINFYVQSIVENKQVKTKIEL